MAVRGRLFTVGRLDLDSEGQLVASVLSKKIAAGATHVVLDIPVGPTAKVRDQTTAARLARFLEDTSEAFGLVVQTVISDGTQPIGRGIGPALEARDVLAILKGDPAAPLDLREKSLLLAGAALEMVGLASGGAGVAKATAALDDGRAWATFQQICEEQGGMREPPRAAVTIMGDQNVHSAFDESHLRQTLESLATPRYALGFLAAVFRERRRHGDRQPQARPDRQACGRAERQGGWHRTSCPCRTDRGCRSATLCNPCGA